MTEPAKRYRLRSSVRMRVASSAAAGAVVLAISNLTNQDFIEGLLLSILVAGIVLITEMLSDFEGQIRLIRQDHRDERVSTKAARLRAKVEQSPVPGESVDFMLEQIGKLTHDTTPLLSAVIDMRIKDVGTFAKQVHEADRYGGPGQSAAEQPYSITYHGEDREWLLALTALTTKCIDAISLSTIDAGVKNYDGGLWTSDLGHRYVELQRSAIEREVHVRRLFFFDRPDIPEDAIFQRICLRQQAIGVEVRILAEESLHTPLRDLVSDFIVFDKELGYEMSSDVALPDGHKPERLRTTLTSRPDRVQHLQKRFDQLWDRADEPPWLNVIDSPVTPATEARLGVDQAGMDRPDPTKP